MTPEKVYKAPIKEKLCTFWFNYIYIVQNNNNSLELLYIKKLKTLYHYR